MEHILDENVFKTGTPYMEFYLVVLLMIIISLELAGKINPNELITCEIKVALSKRSVSFQ